MSCLDTVCCFILLACCVDISHSSTGEIREEMPDKKVTLVTSKELMPSANPIFPDKFRARLLAKLEAINVTVHTDAGHLTFDKEDVNDCGFIVGRRTYSWNGGEMEADLCVIATGWRYTPPLYQDSGLESWLDEKGFLAVGGRLRVSVYATICDISVRPFPLPSWPSLWKPRAEREGGRRRGGGGVTVLKQYGSGVSRGFLS